jgi:hypothetical protein
MTDGKLVQLIYASSAVELMDDGQLLALLQQSRQNNSELGLTGILLYKGGNFLQVLEGEEDKVMALYDKIRNDPRHRQVLTIATRPIKERDFGDWTMAYVNLNKVKPEDVPGYSEFLNEPFEVNYLAGKPSLAMRFIQVFKENMR